MSDFQQFEIGLRNRFRAARAWMRTEDQYDGLEHKRHFRDGFKEGYIAGAMNADACPPSIPPQKYWSVRYQSPEGREKVNAWFEGYSHGLLEANVDGIHYFTEIPTMGLNHQMTAPDASHEVWLDGDPSPSQMRELAPAPIPEPEPVPVGPPLGSPNLPVPREYDEAGVPSGPTMSGYRNPEPFTNETRWTRTSSASTSPVSLTTPAKKQSSGWRQPEPLFLPEYSTVR